MCICVWWGPIIKFISSDVSMSVSFMKFARFFVYYYAEIWANFFFFFWLFVICCEYIGMRWRGFCGYSHLWFSILKKFAVGFDDRIDDGRRRVCGRSERLWHLTIVVVERIFHGDYVANFRGFLKTPIHRFEGKYKKMHMRSKNKTASLKYWTW